MTTETDIRIKEYATETTGIDGSVFRSLRGQISLPGSQPIGEIQETISITDVGRQHGFRVGIEASIPQGPQRWRLCRRSKRRN